MQKRIFDSHHHLWDYDPEQYPWIPKDSVAAQSYNLDDLAEHSGTYDLQATIAVHARQTLAENDWLIEQAKKHRLCKGVVGWVPMLDARIDDVLARYTNEPLFKGVRYAIQNENDPDFMLCPAFTRGIKAVSKTDLRYDILIYAHQLPKAIELIDMLRDDMPLVLDHIAKPVITPDVFDEQWARDLVELANRSNVMCKLSGMITEVRSDEWSIETIRPYFDTALEAFGPERLMFGSDWPVCLLKSEYQHWVYAVLELISTLSEAEQDKILYLNAASFYNCADQSIANDG